MCDFFLIFFYGIVLLLFYCFVFDGLGVGRWGLFWGVFFNVCCFVLFLLWGWFFKCCFN